MNLGKPGLRRALPPAIILAVAGGCLAFWMALGASQSREREELRQRVEARVQQLSEAAEQQFEAALRGVDTGLRHLRTVYRHDRRAFDGAVRDLIQSHPPDMLKFVTVVGVDGYLAYSSGGAAERTYFGDREHFRVHADGGPDRLFVSAPIVGRLGHVPLVQVTRAILDREAFRGVIGIPLRPEYLSEQLRSLRIAQDDLIAIVRPSGHIIARTHGLEAALKATVPADRPYLSAKAGEHGLFRDESTFDKAPMLFSWRRLAMYPVIVVAAVNEASESAALLGHQAADRTRSMAGTVVVMLCAVLLAIVFSRLDRALRELGESERRHRALFERSQVPMALVDPAGGAIVDVNEAAVGFYGHDRRRMRAMNVAELGNLSPEAIRGELDLARSARPGAFEHRHRLAGGELRDVEVHSGPVTIDGRALLFAVIHDITARKSAERALARETAELAALLATASDGIHILDGTGHLVRHSRSFAAMLGYTDGELAGAHLSLWEAVMSPDEIARRLAGLIEVPERFETRHRRKDGTFLDVEINAKGIEIGGRTHLYASSRDITGRKSAEEQLRVAATAFETQEGIVITDTDGVVLRVNHSFTEITGYRPEQIVGRRTSVLQSGRHDRAFYAAMWQALAARGAWQGEIWNRRQDGEVYPEWLTITAVRDDAGEVTHYVGGFTDITQRKAAEERIQALAFFDPLTRLPNRRLLSDRLHQALATAARSRRSGALLFIDLDDFKTVNDSLGHDIGDRLLQSVAERLRGCVREGDTVARLGGDEFVVMLEDLHEHGATAAGQAETVGAKILEALGRHHLVAGHRIESTPSIGATLFGAQGTTAEEAMRHADLAMYRAKAAGRNTLRFFDPQMQAAVEERARLATELRRAPERQQLELHYQRQVDASGGTLGVEALVRWRHPSRGLVGPAEFIPLAEETGFIRPLGRWVLESACREAVERGGEDGHFARAVAVNVSARQFRHRDFVREVMRVLERTGIDPRRLKLELTESVVLDDVEDAIARMSALASAGVSFSLDDFGTGYSSLYCLKRLPVAELKIDRSFVRDILVDANDAPIVRTIVDLARNLGMAVIAEGVETTAQRDALERLGCRAFQGYLYGHPAPAGASGRAEAPAAASRIA